MSDLQAVIEAQVELYKFYNIDLFQRGYYQIRTTLKTSPKTTAKVDVSLTRSHGTRISPSCVLNGSVAVSKTFQILYRKEDVELFDVFGFKVYMLVDINKIEQCMADADFQLVVELWFTEEEVRSDTVFQCVSTRIVELHMRPDRGIHHYLPLQFDYFHLSAVCMTVHATIIALHQSYISLSGSYGNIRDPVPVTNRPDPTALPSEFVRPASAPPSKSSSRRIQQAFERHKRMCRVLLCVYECLQSSFESLVMRLPSHKQLVLEHVDCHVRLEEMLAKCQRYSQVDEEDMVQATQSDITTLCGQNVLLWMQYLELVTFNKRIMHQLAKEHHTQRVKRFAEGFFVNEYHKQEMIACFDSSVHGHADIVNLVRSSVYYQSIPALVAECRELDGDCATLPIIFEDNYSEQPVATTLSSVEEVELRNPNKSPPGGRGSRYSRMNRDSTYSSASSMSDASMQSGRKSGKIKFRGARPESFLRPTLVMGPADVEGQVATDKKDCTLVGYRKVDASGVQQRPSVELGTLTSASSCAAASLIGSGIVMHPGLLYNAVSLPTLYTGGKRGNDPNSTLTGSMPMLAANDPAADEQDLAPYTRGQQDRVQFVAQNSSSSSSTSMRETVGGAGDDRLDQKEGNLFNALVQSGRQTLPESSLESIPNDGDVPAAKSDTSSKDIGQEVQRLTDTLPATAAAERSEGGTLLSAVDSTQPPSSAISAGTSHDTDSSSVPCASSSQLLTCSNSEATSSGLLSGTVVTDPCATSGEVSRPGRTDLSEDGCSESIRDQTALENRVSEMVVTGDQSEAGRLKKEKSTD